MHCGALIPRPLSPAWPWVPSSSLTGTIAELANTTNEYGICSEQLHISKLRAFCKAKGKKKKQNKEPTLDLT